MLFIAFMLNILKIRFDFLCSDTVLSGKWKVKTQHEETIFLPRDCQKENEKKKKNFRGRNSQPQGNGCRCLGARICMRASKC